MGDDLTLAGGKPRDIPRELWRPHIAMADLALPAAHPRSTGEPGDAEADALLAEIERRELSV